MTDIDLSGQPSWKNADPNILPSVKPSLIGVRRTAVGWIGRLRAGAEMYAPVPDVDQGGLLELSQAQVRHLYAEFGKRIAEWDNEPRDLVGEADEILSDAGHFGRNRASTGFEVETDGAVVYVYHSTGRGRDERNETHAAYARALKGAGYTGLEGAPEPTVQGATEEHAARVVAVPPAAESF
ncbi:hypothetical protein ABZS76_32830 [Streptomyces sp. NPDC005562]|uniref:hypothetical protein n=1 Tax=Streptomyces sp. NPDC005562 TaxID=3154890 RepID=UPI0033BF6F50